MNDHQGPRMLAALYEIYENFANPLETACAKGCAHCCTCNVTLTSLEARAITSRIRAGKSSFSLEALSKKPPGRRYQPKTTINGLAKLCAQGQEPPAEENDPHWGPCPLLTEDICPIYAARPFACRCMLSSQPCGRNGFADMDPFVLTVNNVFMQYIEHIDARGRTGNLTDMLQTMAADPEPGQSAENAAPGPTPGLIANRPIPVLMIPPEHRTRIQPILAEISKIK